MVITMAKKEDLPDTPELPELADVDLEQPKKTRKSRAPRQVTATKKEKLSARQLTGILYVGHSSAAQYLAKPIIAIEESEAAQIAEAIVDVMQHYDFDVSAKALAWANLAGVLATVYGFKILASIKSVKSESPAQVINLGG